MDRLLVIRLLLALVLIPLAFALLSAPQFGMARLLGFVVLGVFGVVNGALAAARRASQGSSQLPTVGLAVGVQRLPTA